MQIITAIIQRCLPVIAGVLLVASCTETREEVCFPRVDESLPQYVIGFGGLFYEATRRSRLEGATGVKLLPIMVNDFQRGWIARSKPGDVKDTSLAITAAKGKQFNGILLSVSPSIIKGMDRKEHKQCRVLVSREQLQSMTGMSIPEKGQFWIYQVQSKQLNKPAANYPILQSRVDEFLTGCIEQGERFQLPDFSRQCIRMTDGWSVHWSNDRARPVGGKPVQIRFKEVDKLLEQLEGNLYENIRAH
ncbi:hypothetical protein [Endozoicomonas sp. Mp262]|uniref:hypothetical protein n=1 Tax=Endozoicomonas sp. Mp262 TaxID=2919499 RepID=UPI0021DB35FA